MIIFWRFTYNRWNVSLINIIANSKTEHTDVWRMKARCFFSSWYLFAYRRRIRKKTTMTIPLEKKPTNFYTFSGKKFESILYMHKSYLNSDKENHQSEISLPHTYKPLSCKTLRSSLQKREFYNRYWLNKRLNRYSNACSIFLYFLVVASQCSFTRK